MTCLSLWHWLRFHWWRHGSLPELGVIFSLISLYSELSTHGSEFEQSSIILQSFS